ncbi:MAG TPA: thioredoxin-disulfide reductase [Spirochaetota bacterium]|nr:thioredoxin-disulfide reductase [Spirochaetota bacterium]
MEDKIYDVVIIGAGPAGLTAGIYGARAGLDIVIIEKFAPGGQVVNSYEIENYPGFTEPIAGWDLMAKMEEQTRRLGVPIESGEVTSMEKINDLFHVNTIDKKYFSRAAIIASGAQNRKLKVAGEEEFLGRGVSYCATCDGAFYKDKVTVVVGGGDVALEEAFFLTKFASKVYIIHRRDKFRGTDILQKRVFGSDKISILYNSVVKEICGKEKVASVRIENIATGQESVIPTDGLFIFVGYDPVNSFVPPQLLNKNGEIKVNMDMQTEIPGLFAAGDVRSNSRRQIVMAAADGATALLAAHEYINNIACK